jgi:hypothetical protein
MLKAADIAVYSPDRELKLVVEVKGKTDATPQWAARMRRNLLAHSIIPPAPFFLLAAREHFYLWRNGTTVFDAKLPDYVVDSRPIVAPYIKNTPIRLERMGDSSLQLIMTSWLSGLVNSKLSPESAEPAEKWIFDSGLYDAIKEGSVEPQSST